MHTIESKEAFSFEQAFGIIENDLGTHFDPRLGALFLTCRDRFEALYKSLEEQESS